MAVSLNLTRLISPDNLVFIQQGVSISVASRDRRLVPSLSRALGCRVAEDGRQLRIILARSQCLDLIRDLENFGAIAVVFTEPTTHRTLQIKGRDGSLVPLQPADIQCVNESKIAFAEEIGQLGFSAEFNGCLFHVEADDLVVITFTPEAVYQQTPGPEAGALLEPNP